MLIRSFAALLAFAAAAISPIADRDNQDRQDRRDRTAIFTCGVDEKLAEPIPLRASLIILAADGRLFEPCPQGNHETDHREARAHHSWRARRDR